MDFNNIVPVLSESVEFIHRDDGQDLVFQQHYGYRLKISPMVRFMLSHVDGKNSLTKLAEIVSDYCNEAIPPQLIYNVLYGKLAECGVVSSGRQVCHSNPSYLKLRITLIKQSFSKHITHYSKYLCSPNIFIPILVATYIYLISFTIIRWNDITAGLGEMDMVNTVIFFTLSSIGLFFHEFGHVSACDRFNAKHGDIGFGFYIFTPVVYADVSDIWRLPVRQRIIVNLAGMYFGNIYCVLVSFIYFATNNVLFLYIALLEFVQSLYNLNPLVKYDGYWVLSDIIDVPNLHKVSYEKVRMILKSYKYYKLKDWLMACYGAISVSYIFVFIFSLLILAPESILYFPINLYKYFSDLFTGNISFAWSGIVSFFPPFLFYWLVVRFIIGYIKQKRNKTLC